MKKKIRCSFTIVLAFLMFLSACGTKGAEVSSGKSSSDEKKPSGALTGSVNLLQGYSKVEKEASETDPDFAKAYAGFSFKLFNSCAKTGGRENMLLSPISVYYSLAILANGAAGNTKDELEQLLGLPTDRLNENLYAFAHAAPSSDDQKMSIANSLWFRDDGSSLTMEPAFLQSVADWYDAELYADPFDSGTMDRVNAWCLKNTDAMIDRIMSSPPADDEMFYLLNAVAFRGKWNTAYEDRQCLDHRFRNTDKSEKTVPMLHSTEDIYLENAELTGFIKPYRYHEFSFAALLPRDENADIQAFAESLSGEEFLSLLETQEYGSIVDVLLPEFTSECSLGLTDPLHELGLRNFFDGKADLSAMGHSALGELSMAGALQRTYIKLDRTGTEAAAVTAMTGAATDIEPVQPKEVHLTRPFVYMILHRDIPVFIGIVSSL